MPFLHISKFLEPMSIFESGLKHWPFWLANYRIRIELHLSAALLT